MFNVPYKPYWVYPFGFSISATLVRLLGATLANSERMGRIALAYSGFLTKPNTVVSKKPVLNRLFIFKTIKRDFDLLKTGHSGPTPTTTSKIRISNHAILIPVTAGVSGGSEDGVEPEPAGEEGGDCCCPFRVIRESGSTQYGRDPVDPDSVVDPDDSVDPEDDPLMETHSPGGGSCTAL